MSRPLTELENLLTEDQRRVVTVDQHMQFQMGLHSDDQEDDFDDQIEVDRADFCPPSRKKDKELSRTLSILDELEMKGGKF